MNESDTDQEILFKPKPYFQIDSSNAQDVGFIQNTEEDKTDHRPPKQRKKVKQDIRRIPVHSRPTYN
jgi:hypothetical protein